MKKQRNGWKVVIFWIGRKCQSKGQLIVMKCWGNRYACFVELCFAFSMVVMVFNVDQVGISHCFGAGEVGDWWRVKVAIYEMACEVKFLQ